MQPTLAEAPREAALDHDSLAARDSKPLHNSVRRPQSDDTPAVDRTAKAAADKPAELEATAGKPVPELAGPVVVEHPKGAILFTHQSPMLSVETAGPRTIVIGREATYTVTMKNSGDVAAQEVLVSVKIPEWTDVARAAELGSRPSGYDRWRGAAVEAPATRRP